MPFVTVTANQGATQLDDDATHVPRLMKLQERRLDEYYALSDAEKEEIIKEYESRPDARKVLPDTQRSKAQVAQQGIKNIIQMVCSYFAVLLHFFFDF